MRVRLETRRLRVQHPTHPNVGQFGQWTIWPGQFGLGQFGLGQFGHQKILDRTTGPDEYNVMGFDFLMTFWGETD